MASQFDLEQGIMSCWTVTSDLNLLLEEITENDGFTQDDLANFVLGLQSIYESKFNKLFRTFEAFLKTYGAEKRQLFEALNELDNLREEVELAEEANLEAADAIAQEHYDKTLEELFLEQEQESYNAIMDENDRLDFIEDELSLA